MLRSLPTDRRTLLATLAASAAIPSVARAAIEPGVPPADRELRVPVQGGSIYVRVNGDLRGPKPPLLMVHGGPGGALWQFFPALPLATQRAIILYDQLDSGRSNAPGDRANWTVDRYVSEIDAIRGALDVPSLHLLGHSWGGIVANRYAAQGPKGLKSLILQGAPLSDSRARQSVQSLVAALPDGAGAQIAARQRGEPVDDAAYVKAMQAFVRRHLNRTSVRDVAMPYMAPTPQDRGDALAAAMTGGDLMAGFSGVLAGFDDEPLLKRIIVPTLLLAGQDDIMTPDQTKALLPLLAKGSFKEIAGAGHMAQFDQPEAWRAAIAAHMAASDGQAA